MAIPHSAAYVFMDAAVASCVCNKWTSKRFDASVAATRRCRRTAASRVTRRGVPSRAATHCCAAAKARTPRHEYVCTNRSRRKRRPNMQSRDGARRCKPAAYDHRRWNRRKVHAATTTDTDHFVGRRDMLMKHKLLAMAIASACFGTCAVANAATAPAPAAQQQDSQQSTGNDQSADANAKSARDKKDKAKQMQAVQVNGFISSIENATALKKNASTIVEAISAEQVGKLPGVSIADALGRLPGLAVQTVDGRPQVLTIHGLGPDFSTALVNGGQQVSTSNNRDVQFDQYPSSWFDNVVVHLSPEADLIGQGLAGTVDMHTIRPLDKPGPIAAVNARYIWNGMSQLADGPGVSNKGYNVNGIWVDQFADHTLGVTLGVDLEHNPSQIEHQAPWGYPTDANGDYVVGGSKNYGISDLMKRSGVLATVQWRPNSFYDGAIDLTYDNFKEIQQAKGMELPLWWGNGSISPGPTMVPGNVVNGFVQSGTYEDINPVIRNDYNSISARVYNFNWQNKFHFNENWSAELDANYSRATRREVDLESYSGTGYYDAANGTRGQPGSFDFSELGDGMLYAVPSLDYTQGVVLTDPQGD